MKYIDFLYIILFLFSLYFLINTKYKVHNKWTYKIIILYFSVFLYVYSIFITNNIINKYILPLLLFLNVAILISITLNRKIEFLNLVGLMGIIYILYIFDYKDFEIKNGLLINPNKQWIYLYVYSLTIFFLLSKFINIYTKIYHILLVWYPLLFPINEFIKHRVISLFFISTLRYYFNILITCSN